MSKALTHATSDPRTATLPPAANASTAFSRSDLLRALTVGLGVVVAVGVGVGVLLFAGTGLLPQSALPYYAIGLGAAAFAAMFSVWLHGRLAATPAPVAARSANYAVTARFQALLASAFGVKLAVLTIGVVALRQFPLTADGAKFGDVATFAVTFAGAALLSQLATAFVIANSLTARKSSRSRIEPQ